GQSRFSETGSLDPDGDWLDEEAIVRADGEESFDDDDRRSDSVKDDRANETARDSAPADARVNGHDSAPGDVSASGARHEDGASIDRPTGELPDDAEPQRSAGGAGER